MKAPGERPCPSCGSTEVVQVQYGLPGTEVAPATRSVAMWSRTDL
jgi:hypothetical protein